MSDTPDIPQHRVIGSGEHSSLCHLLPRPLIMTGFLRDYLTRHFQESMIEEASLRHLIWQNNPATPILIEASHRWRPQTTETRPAILIRRNKYGNQRVGIADRMQGNPADHRGDPHFATYWIGSHTLFCIGGSGAQAELLGAEVQREFTEFAHTIQRSLGLMRFAVGEIDSVHLLREGPETFAVPVVLAYAYEQRWAIRQQARTLNVSFSTSQL